MMHVLQNGLPKSGNYWLFNILNLTLDAAGVPKKSLIENHPIRPIAETWLLSHPDQATLNVLDIEPGTCFFRIGSYFREPIPSLKAYIDANRLVWTHSRYIPESEAVYDAFDKVVYIVRDPRDVAISQAHFAFTPYRQRTHPARFADANEYLQAHLVKHLSGWTQHVGSHLLAPPRKNTHYVFYERMKADLDTELCRLIDFLEVDVSAAQRNEIREQVTVESMKKKSRDHVRSGSSGGWRKTLTPWQIRTTRFIAGGMMRELGYPLGEADEHLPQLPERLDRAAVKATMRKGMVFRGVNFLRQSMRHLKSPAAARIDGVLA